MSQDQPTLTDDERRVRRLFGFGKYANSYAGSHAARAGERAAACVEADPVYLDTETTGLHWHDQIIEIAIVDADVRPIIDTRVKPTVAVGDGAYRVHGIGAHELADALPWPEIAVEVHRVLESRPVVIFNSDFDTRLLAQTAKAVGLPDIRYRSVTCAMDMAAQYFGPTNRYGSISLSNSVAQAGVPQPYPAHSARGDSTATAALVRAIAREHRQKIAAG